MGGFTPKIQPPHLMKPVVKWRDPIIKCALSGELFKHPLVKSHELSGNLKGSVKGRAVNSTKVSRLGLTFHSHSAPSQPAPAGKEGCGRFLKPSLLQITQCTGLPYNLNQRFTYRGLFYTAFWNFLQKKFRINEGSTSRDPFLFDSYHKLPSIRKTKSPFLNICALPTSWKSNLPLLRYNPDRGIVYG